MSIDKTDPFREARESDRTVVANYSDERIPMILRHREVRLAARDWQTYSSDAPCRVPIPEESDVRQVRQLPIEVDPPEHTDYRKLVLPFFQRPLDPTMAPKIEALVDTLLSEAMTKTSVDVVAEFALPLQSRALTHLLNMPMEESELWISWGTHVFRTGGDSLDTEQAGALDRYIEQQLDRAEDNPGADFFSELHRAQFKGRGLTREEMTGIANLTFAGGRDTIINLVSSGLGYLAQNPKALQQLRENPSLINTATEEFVRYFSPKTHIGRVATKTLDIKGEAVEVDQRVSLCWASANRDASVFEAPAEVRLDRKPNPHLGFGHGPHSCLGAPQARLVMRSVLKRLVERVSTLELITAEQAIEQIGGIERNVGFEQLHIRFSE
ncbi:cytochrome P450 [Pseudomaricurvus alkylphenolicus]|uniref:cytochrome P450 n=1 Tax=Pseudomaricurvus alkylphenolicus TaxID=1306991 RepID=UPI0014239697|nr:cytochrome P450 [Pseudomaricurvus alkylphenolicus]NIB38120.1 cytochrome P450 [Pseudomaricurvus alkylphenolicus]